MVGLPVISLDVWCWNIRLVLSVFKMADAGSYIIKTSGQTNRPVTEYNNLLPNALLMIGPNTDAQLAGGRTTRGPVTMAISTALTM